MQQDVGMWKKLGSRISLEAMNNRRCVIEGYSFVSGPFPLLPTPSHLSLCILATVRHGTFYHQTLPTIIASFLFLQ